MHVRCRVGHCLGARFQTSARSSSNRNGDGRSIGSWVVCGLGDGSQGSRASVKGSFRTAVVQGVSPGEGLRRLCFARCEALLV